MGRQQIFHQFTRFFEERLKDLKLRLKDLKLWLKDLKLWFKMVTIILKNRSLYQIMDQHKRFKKKQATDHRPKHQNSSGFLHPRVNHKTIQPFDQLPKLSFRNANPPSQWRARGLTWADETVSHTPRNVSHLVFNLKTW